MSGNVPILYSIYTRNVEDSSRLVLELDANNIWLVVSGFSRSPCYQYFRAAILKRKISNIKGMIITNTHAGRFGAIIKFLKDNEPIIDTLKDHEYELVNDFDDKMPIFEI
ncbi:1821_t:CDS:2 [Gigaspora margarita]|uniref:1821_t:CDS:1 n=1 Tax=Gigaspora margarita TaxID=4874 RepID=A0ABN7VUL1_GIGMA|nr:1821_t:CDS:2 [Gigaspora margarita]